MDKLRKIIRDLIKEESDLQMDFGDKDKARRALIALSKNQIPANDRKVDGRLSDAYRDEDGHYDEDGDIEIEFYFEGIKFNTIINVTGSYYYKKGWGGDYMQPPDEDMYEDEEITINDDEITVGDDDDHEYDFNNSELGPNFQKDMESFLLNYYDASESSIG
jgi:hypothetical protein